MNFEELAGAIQARAQGPHAWFRVCCSQPFGFHLRVRRDGQMVQCDLATNVYYGPRGPLSASAQANLKALGLHEVSSQSNSGWEAVAPTLFRLPGRLMSAPSDLTDLTVAIFQAAGAPEQADLVVYDLAEPIPDTPHALTYWDWKDCPNIDELETAIQRILVAGGHHVHLLYAETYEDEYALVISARKLSQEEANTVWIVSVQEMTDPGGELVGHRC